MVYTVKYSPKIHLLLLLTSCIDIYTILQTTDVRAKSHECKIFEYLLVEISAEFLQAGQKVPHA